MRDRGTDRLPELLADDERLAGFEEGRLFGGDWLRSLGMIPNEYLYFFYYGSDTVAAIRELPESRGAFLLEQQRAFYAQNGEVAREALAAWRATRHDRERTYMAEARSAAGDSRRARDRGERRLRDRGDGGARGDGAQHAPGADPQHREPVRLPVLDEQAVVEVPAVVGRAGPQPLAVGAVPAHAGALVALMKDVERTTIEAALTGSRALAIRALALHPLVPSVSTAQAIFDGYRERLPALRAAFP